MFPVAQRRHTLLWALAVLSVMLVAMALQPATGRAQSCTDCVLYAVTELNLRQDPSLDATVLRFVPEGATVQRAAGEEINGYAPITYDSVPGWVVALGLVASLEDVGAAVSPEEPAPAAAADGRYTLSPLVLRSGPSGEAEPILTMPEGAVVTLTREGAEGGYVTVDYDGVTGWAYADLLGGESGGS